MLSRDGRLPAVGIDAAGVDCGAAVVTVAELYRDAAGPDGRVQALGMDSRGVALPCDDPVVFGTTAGRRALAQLSPAEREGIELLVFATECGLDLSKSLAGYAHRLLGLPATCRTLEVKQACYSATAALQLAAALVAVSPRPHARALVLTGDVGRHRLGSMPDAVTGAGGVAVVVSADPRIVTLTPGVGGLHSHEVLDTLRPRYTEEIADADLSLLTYLECARACWHDYAAKVPGADLMKDFELLAMHTPFAAMVKGAHRTLVREIAGLPPGQIAADFARRAEPSLVFARRTGNIYTGTALLCLLSALVHGSPADRSAIGVFSYGSGCCAEFYRCEVVPGARERVLAAGIEEVLGARHPLTLDEYVRLAGADVPAGVRQAGVERELAGPALRRQQESGLPRLMLTGVENYRRRYAWTDGATP